MAVADKKQDKPKVAEQKDSGKQTKVIVAAKKIELQLPTLSLEMGPDFVMKLVLMGLLALIFVFALIIFTRANFSTSDAVDFSRLQYNLPKLWGLWFMVFALVFSLAIALSVLHGFKASRLQAGFPLILLFLIAAVAGVMFPSYSLAFYAFAISVGIASIAASLEQQLTLKSIWAITSKALFALLVLSLVFSYAKFSSNKDGYFNQMLGSVAGVVPDLVSSSTGSIGQQALNLCADAVDSVNVTREVVIGAISKSNIAAAVESTGNILYTGLPSSTKEAIVDSMYQSSINQTVVLAAKLKSNMAGQMRNITLGSTLSKSDIASKLTPTEIRKVLDKVPAFAQVQDAFPAIAALTIMSLITILNLFLHVFATVFAWALSKVI